MKSVEVLIGIFIGLGTIIAAFWKYGVKPTIQYVKSRNQLYEKMEQMVLEYSEMKAKMDDSYQKVNTIYYEIKPNGGSSLKDQVSRIEKLQLKHDHELTKSVWRQRVLLEYQNLGIIEFDEHGDCIFSNQIIAEIFEVDTAEMKNNGWLSGIHHTERKKVLENWKASIEKNIPYFDEFLLINDKKVKAIGHACVIDSYKKPIGYFVTVWLI